MSPTYRDIYVAYENSGYRSNFSEISKRNTYDLDKNVLKVNGDIIASTTSKNFQSTETVNIFREKNVDKQEMRYIKMKLYYAKIYDDDTLVRDYIPVVDLEGDGCLFDKINKECYYNQGIGDFSYSMDEKYYTKINYIESTGTQYIDAGILVNQDTRIVVDANITDDFKTGYYQAIFGVADSGEKNRFTLHLSPTYQDIYVAYENSGYRSNFSEINKRNTYDLDKNVLKVNGDIIASTTSKNFQSTETVNIFREKNVDKQEMRYIKMKLYSFKIYDNNNIIRDYIPLLSRYNRPCLFDKVEKKCYYNQGTGEFLYG